MIPLSKIFRSDSDQHFLQLLSTHRFRWPDYRTAWLPNRLMRLAAPDAYRKIDIAIAEDFYHLRTPHSEPRHHEKSGRRPCSCFEGSRSPGGFGASIPTQSCFSRRYFFVLVIIRHGTNRASHSIQPSIYFCNILPSASYLLSRRCACRLPSRLSRQLYMGHAENRKDLALLGRRNSIFLDASTHLFGWDGCRQLPDTAA